ncbi:protein kinase [Elasticomyces elasticus]|nr:protein kinase [Elasticomyces elasticus]
MSPINEELVYCNITLIATPNLEYVIKEPQNDQFLLPTDERPSRKRANKHVIRDNTPEPSRHPLLALSISKTSMKNPHRGHLFGSDADMCDVLLDANNDNGISRVHFRLLLELGEKNDQPETLWIINNSSSGPIVVNNIQVPFNQQHGLKPRVAYTVDAGPAHLCIVFADHCLDTGALNELRAARREPNRTIGQRKIEMTRRQTPLFNSNLDEWTTHPDIPWHHKGQYIMQNKILGGGNHSTVRKARRSVEGTLVAIKIIGNGNGGRITLRLLDYVRYEPAPCATLLALEFAPYGTLHTQFQYTKAGEDLCRTILSQVLAALQLLEKESVVHRDVSPDNILVFDQDWDNFYCKLADFSYARDLSQDRPWDVQGTPGFMALECVEGKECDIRADVFACASVGLWIMNPEEIMFDIRFETQKPEMLESMAKRLRQRVPSKTLRAMKLSHQRTTVLDAMLSNDLGLRPTATLCLQYFWFTGDRDTSEHQDEQCTPNEKHADQSDEHAWAEQILSLKPILNTRHFATGLEYNVNVKGSCVLWYPTEVPDFSKMGGANGGTCSLPSTRAPSEVSERSYRSGRLPSIPETEHALLVAKLGDFLANE